MVVTPTMLRRLTGTLLALSLLATAGLAAASDPLASLTGQGGGDVQGEAEGAYYADASDGIDKVENDKRALEGQAHQQVHDKNEAYQEAKWDAYNESKVDRPQPECTCEELEGQMRQLGDVQAQHTDRVEKRADVDTEYADAGADLSAAGQVSAWAKDTFQGVADAFDAVQDVFDQDPEAEEDARAELENGLEAEDELRNEVVSQADADTSLPDVDPRAEGEAQAEHATSVTSQATGNGEAEIP